MNETGFVNADEYGEICTIEVGAGLVLKVKDNHITHYLLNNV